MLKKKGPHGERDKPSAATRYTIKDWISSELRKKKTPGNPQYRLLQISVRSIHERPLTLVYREEERHRALGRDATFTWSRVLTHPPRCNRTRHRGRHLGSEVVGAAILVSWGPPSWIESRGGRHLGVVGAAILDRK